MTGLVDVNGSQISYRGRWIRDALIAHLASAHGLAAATDVVVGGCSAGGLTVYLNLDAVAAQITALSPAAPARVRGLADAGFFLDVPDWKGKHVPRPKADQSNHRNDSQPPPTRAPPYLAPTRAPPRPTLS